MVLLELIISFLVQARVKCDSFEKRCFQDSTIDARSSKALLLQVRQIVAFTPKSNTMDNGIGILNRDDRIDTPALHHRMGTPAPAPCRISAMSSSYGVSVANRLLSPMVAPSFLHGMESRPRV